MLSILEGRQGSSEERFALASQLLEKGLIDQKDMTLWDGEEWRAFQMKGHTISGEPKLSPTLSNAQRRRMDKALEAIRRGELTQAKAILEQLTADAPNDPSVWANLAAVYEHQGDKKQRDALIERAVEVDPEYLMGRCNLAIIKLQRGNIEAAKKLLDGLLDQTDLHVQEAITLYGVHAVFNAKTGDHEQAQKMLDSMASIAEEFDETERLEDYRGMVKRIQRLRGPSFLKGLFSSSS